MYFLKIKDIFIISQFSDQNQEINTGGILLTSLQTLFLFNHLFQSSPCSSGPQPLGTRDWFCGREFFHRLERWRLVSGWFSLSRKPRSHAYAVQCTSPCENLMLPLIWQEAVIQALGSNCNYRWNFPGSLTAHLLLCSWVPNAVLVLGPGVGTPACSVRRENLRSQAEFSIVQSLSVFTSRLLPQLSCCLSWPWLFFIVVIL